MEKHYYYQINGSNEWVGPFNSLFEATSSAQLQAKAKAFKIEEVKKGFRPK